MNKRADTPDMPAALRLLAEDHQRVRRMVEQARNPELADTALTY